MSDQENDYSPSEWRGLWSRCGAGALVLLLSLIGVAGWDVYWIVRAGVSWPAVVSLVLSLGAVLVAPRWAPPSPAAFPEQALYQKGNRWRSVLLVAGAATLLAIWPRSIVVKQSLSQAEIAVVEAGLPFGWRPESSAPGAWSATLLKSVCNDRNGKGPWSRLEAGAGAATCGGSSEDFGHVNELGLRLVPCVSGIVAVGLLGLLGAVAGRPVTGLAAGAILAVHPQHIQWSGGIGGNSTMLLCFTGSLLCLIFALQTNRWRWWLGLAATQAGCLLSNGASFAALAGMNVVAAILIFRAPAVSNRGTQCLRLATVFTLSVVPLATAFWAAGNGGNFPIPGMSFQWSRIVCGLPAGNAAEPAGPGASLAQIQADTPWRGAVITWLLPACAAVGLLFMTRQDWRTRLMLAGIGAGLLFSEKPVSLLFAVLLLPLALAWAGAGLAKIFPRDKRLTHAPVFVASVYVLTILPALHAVMALPAQPLREVAVAARPESEHDTKTITATLPSTSGARIYDPQVHLVTSAADLERLVDDAFERDRPLLVFYSSTETLPDDWPQIRERLEQSGRFKPVQDFAGLEPSQEIRLCRYQPGEKIIHLNLKPEK